MKVLCTCHRRRRAKGRKKHRGKIKWLLLFMLRYCYHVWPLLSFVVCLFAGLLVCLFVCSLVCFLLLAVAVVVVMVWFAVSSQSSNELCKSTWKNMWHFRTNDTQGQRKGRRRPLNWILGVLPRHLKIPLPRPSFQPLKQTKEDSDFHCPLVRFHPFSDFRPEPWEQNKEWRLEKLPNNNELRWTTMNYEKFEPIDSH